MIKVSNYFIPYVILLILLGFRGQLLVAFAIVLFHEMVHYIAARHYGFSGFDIEILPLGAVLKLKELDEANTKEDIIISISGPIANLMFAAFFYYMWTRLRTNYMYMLYTGNLIIGLFNLIPAFPLDGGRIIRGIISYKTYFKEANKITVYISVTIGIFFMFFYFYMFVRGINNINIGLIALFIIISSLKEKERIVYIIMGDIIKKKIKFINRGYIENRSISLYYKKDLLSALSMVDKNKYNIFTILDDNMAVMDIIYEEEIVEALKLYGNITVEEFMKSK